MVNDLGKTAILIAGMHRSGTSALAGSLTKAGISPGYTLLFRTDDNQKGYYENTEVYNLNEHILKENGYSWDSLDLLEWSIDNDTIQKYENIIFELLQREFEGETNILIKDPRLSYLLPIWINALTKSEFHPVVIIQLREIYDIIKSLVRRNKFTTFKASVLLVQHLLASSDNSSNVPIFHTCFEDLLNDKGIYIKKLFERIGLHPDISYNIYRKKIDFFLDKSLTTKSKKTKSNELIPKFVQNFDTNFRNYLNNEKALINFISEFKDRFINLSESSILFAIEKEIADDQVKHKEQISELKFEIQQKEAEFDRIDKLEKTHQTQIAELTSQVYRSDSKITSLLNQLDDIMDLKNEWDEDRSKILSLFEQNHRKIDSLNQDTDSKIKEILSLISHDSNTIAKLEKSTHEIYRLISEHIKPPLHHRITKKIKILSRSFSRRFRVISNIIFICIKSPLKSIQQLNLKNLRILLNAIKNEEASDVRNNFESLLTGRSKANYANKQASQFAYNIENVAQTTTSVRITGWITHPKGVQKIRLNLEDRNQFEIKYGLKREDVWQLFQHYNGSEFSGFTILLQNPVYKDIRALVDSYDGDRITLSIFKKHENDSETTYPQTKNKSNLLLSQFEFYRNPNPEYFIDYSPKEEIRNGLIKLIAFFLPQFHSIPENDRWWGKNFTEWTNVTQGIPRFKDHYQPRLPGDLGFYDLHDLEVLKQQITIAKNYGLHGFCFHYYWFQGKHLLEKPLNNFINSDIDFNFCICWANENWTRKWDGFDDEILIEQDYTGWDPSHFVQDIIPILKDDRYIKVGGKHLLIIYRPNLIPNTKEVAQSWRKEFAENQIDILLVSVQGFGLEDPREVGFDCALEFPPHKLGKELEIINETTEYYDSHFEGYIHNYKDMVHEAKKVEAPDKYNLIRTLFPSWDNEARRKGRGTSAYINSSPELYSEWLELCCNYSLKYPLFDEQLVFINAWNEWAEGAYLEPDRHFGYRYLEATYNILKDFTPHRSRKKLILVSHDARRHGAQLNALHMSMTIKKQFGFHLIIILLEGGELVGEFRKISETHLLSDLNQSSVKKLLKDVSARGFKKAICNTTVSGKIIPALVDLDIECVALIHELPQLITDYQLEPIVKIISEKAYKQVFAAEVVQEGFNSFLDNPDRSKQLIIPQGVYALDFDNLGKYDGSGIRDELNLKKSDVLIGGAGFGDYRKGIDLFIEAAKLVISQRDGIYFVWFGNLESGIVAKIDKILKDPSLRKRIRILDFREDIISCLKGLNIFLLTSREDPFPSVVLESLSLGVPCITFEDNGGICDLNKYGDIIQTVGFSDTRALAKKIIELIDDPESLHHYSKEGAHIMRENFSFDEYMFSICRLFDEKLKKISVIVPNYNYGSVIEERLRSIWRQDYPIFETIILDDNSSDNSIQQIYAAEQKYDRRIRLFINEENSGSVFQQWHRGISLARGQYIWIAEADDSAEPQFLDALVSLFENQKGIFNIGMAYCQSKQVDFSGNELANDYRYYTDDISATKWLHEYYKLGHDEIREGLSVKNTILNASSVLWDLPKLREIINKVLDPLCEFRIAGDWFLYIHMLLDYDIAFCPQSLNIHRRHNTSQTKAISRKRHLQEIELMYAIIDKKIGYNENIQSTRSEYLYSVERYLKKSQR